jgi:hypothetical protein
MNTNRTSTPVTTRITALTACLIALYAGTMACGTDDGADDGPAPAPAAIGKQGTSQNAIHSARANQAESLRQLRAKRAQTRPHSFGDDRHQPTGQGPTCTDS